MMFHVHHWALEATPQLQVRLHKHTTETPTSIITISLFQLRLLTACWLVNGDFTSKPRHHALVLWAALRWPAEYPELHPSVTEESHVPTNEDVSTN